MTTTQDPPFLFFKFPAISNSTLKRKGRTSELLFRSVVLKLGDAWKHKTRLLVESK